MEKPKEGLLAKSNPLRSDLRWQVVLLQGVLAIAIGIYALAAEASAAKNIVFLIGVFLLLSGISAAAGGIRRSSSADPMAQFRILRAGIGIGTGAIVVVNRFLDFMGVNSARYVVGIGLLGMGLVSLIGIIALIGKSKPTIGSVVLALVLIIWGAAAIYLAYQEETSAKLIGWTALIIGVALVGLALIRRKQKPVTILQPTAE